MESDFFRSVANDVYGTIEAKKLQTTHEMISKMHEVYTEEQAKRESEHEKQVINVIKLTPCAIYGTEGEIE